MSVRDLLRDNDERFSRVGAWFQRRRLVAARACASAGRTIEVLAHLVVGLSASLPLDGRRDGPSPRRLRRRERRHGRGPCGGAITHRPARRFRAAEPEPQGLGRYFPSRLFLGDHVTHELDMVFALGMEPEVRADALTAVLNTQVAVPNPFVPAFRNSQGPAAGGDRHRMEPRRSGTRGRRPRRRTGVRARQPAEGAATPERRRRRRARGAAQPPDPYGRVRISM